MEAQIEGIEERMGSKVERVTANDSFKISVKENGDVGQWLERSREDFSF